MSGWQTLPTRRMTADRRSNRLYKTILPAVVSGGPKFTNSVVYDLANRRLYETNALGVLSLFGYDGVGRLLSVTNGLGSGTATNSATYATTVSTGALRTPQH